MWRATYQQTAAPPEIDWFQNCSGPYGEPGVLDYGVCVGGYFDGWMISLPWTGSYSSSEMAHEMLHAKQSLEGIYDPDHQNPEWSTLLPLAISNLKENGL